MPGPAEEVTASPVAWVYAGPDFAGRIALRSHLKSLGISLRSATEPIDDTATGKLMEGVLASFAQFDNDVRSDRTRAGMKAALEIGRWTFLAPIGYVNVPKSFGKSLIHDPDRARLFKRFSRISPPVNLPSRNCSRRPPGAG